MKEAGIIDPAKVTRVALENAASVAGTILLTECVVVDNPEDKKESVEGRRITGAPFALWEEPYFEVGLPVREQGGKVVTCVLRVGLKSIPR